MSLPEIGKHFDKPIEEAVKAIGVCATVLKKVRHTHTLIAGVRTLLTLVCSCLYACTHPRIPFLLHPTNQTNTHTILCLCLHKVCRRHDIRRWPYRQVKSLDRTLSSLRLAHAATVVRGGGDSEEAARVKAQIEALESRRGALMQQAAITTTTTTLLLGNANADAAAQQGEGERPSSASSSSSSTMAASPYSSSSSSSGGAREGAEEDGMEDGDNKTGDGGWKFCRAGLDRVLYGG